MTTDIETSKTFQDRIFERIRDQIGDLMTDADLKALVDSAMQKAFFEPTHTKDRWGAVVTGDPAFVALVRTEMSTRVTKAMHDWLAAHPDEIAKVIDEALAKGMFGLVKQHIEMSTAWPLNQLAEQLRSKGVLG